MGHQKKQRSDEDIDRDRQIRAKYEHRPNLNDLIAGGEYEAPIKQGEYLSLMQLAAQIRERRQKLNLSLADVANLSGIDKASISRLENGLVDNPTVGTLMRIVRSLRGRLRIEIEDDSPVASN